MAGYIIKFDRNGDEPMCRLEFGHANTANYWIYKFVPNSPNPELLASGIVTGGEDPEHALGGSAADLDGAGITIVARFISPLIDAQGPENFASLTVSFLQNTGEAAGSPRTTTLPLKNGVAAFDVRYRFSAA